MEELIGSLFQDRYHIKSLISRQTGRRTFLAIDRQTNNEVAIKLLLFGPDFTWEDLKLFEREAEVLKSLDHPTIPKYLNFFEVELKWGKGFALVQSYIAAKSLQQCVQEGRTFSESELKEIATDLLKILDYLHSRQPAVIHRDIKPSNILLTDRTAHSSGKVYLVDFGSVQTAIKGGTRTIVGTYGYMPPEQFGGIATPATDIYALGVTLIYLSTGSHPDQLPQQELRLQFEDRVNLSPRLIRWLQKSIVPNAEKRFQSAQQALLNLNGGISSCEDSLDPISKKPFGSKLQIKKTRDRLEILLPPKDFSLIALVTFVIVCGFFSYFYSLGLSALSMFYQNIASRGEFGIVAILYFGLCLAIVLSGVYVFVSIYSSVKLIISPLKISLSYYLFTSKWKHQQAKTEHVQKIELSSPVYRKDFIGNDIIQKKINIWAGTQQISFGAWGLRWLTQPELEWISNSLSEWLEIPVTKN
jgi:serine/threonine protein kinase